VPQDFFWPIDVAFSQVKPLVNNKIAKQIRYGMEARLLVEKDSKEETTASKECTDDSEFCFNGRCRKR